jgi:hypothetical protein
MFSALREMETRLGERFVGHFTSLTPCARAFMLRTTAYVDDDGLAFDLDPFYENLDEELFANPVVDAVHQFITALCLSL